MFVGTSIQAMELFLDLNAHTVPPAKLKKEVLNFHKCLVEFYEALKRFENPSQEEVETSTKNLFQSLISSNAAVTKLQGKST